jgi:ribosomal protein S18 acetylase RimI-like enzyme
MYKILQANEQLIDKFLKNAGHSLDNFRYFNKRSISIIENHVCTIVLSKGDIIVGYGHLDKENEKIWLGICVAEYERGKGCGKIIMNFLVEFARSQNFKTIYLTVDTLNTSAISLYEKYFFRIEENISSQILLMKLIL